MVENVREKREKNKGVLNKEPREHEIRRIRTDRSQNREGEKNL